MPAKKGAKKKIVKRAVTPKKETSIRRAQDKPVGVVTHFYTKIKVAIVKFKKAVKVGAVIRFEGNKTNFSQTIGSLQYDHKPIAAAPKGKQVGLKVTKRVREGDGVYLEK